MSEGIRLVTRGDDAGSCASANRAIREACRDGVLRNASIMVPGPAFDEVPQALAGLDGICLGLHVVLNAEWDGPKWGPVLPAAQVPSLVDEHGHFTRTPNELNAQGANVDEMVAEVQAQLDRASAAGLQLSYLDEHMGVGWVGGLRQRLAELARREGLADAHGLRHLPMLSPFDGDPVERLIASLRAAPSGNYVYVTHPGCDAEDMRRFSHAGLAPGQIARERDADRRLWLDPRLRQYGRDHDVEFVRYTDVLIDNV